MICSILGRALGVLVVSLVALVGCQQATPVKEPEPASPTVSRDDFNKFWQGYLRIFSGAKLHFGVSVGLIGGGVRNSGFFEVIDASDFRVSFIESDGFLLSAAAYSVPLSTTIGDVRDAVHVSGAYISTNESVRVSLPYSLSATLPGFGSLMLEHNYRLEGSSLVFVIITNALPTGG